MLPAPNKPMTMSSREMAELINVDHMAMCNQIRSDLNQCEGVGSPFDYFDRQAKEFNLPRNLVNVVISGYSVPYRQKIINRLDEVEKRLAQQQLPDFSNPAAAARAWADAQDQLALVAPKVALAELISDPDNHQYIRDVAKQFGWGQKKFISMLIRERLLYRTNNEHGAGILYPYSNHEDKFKLAQEYIHGAMRPVTKITGLGVSYIASFINEVDPI